MQDINCKLGSAIDSFELRHLDAVPISLEVSTEGSGIFEKTIPNTFLCVSHGLKPKVFLSMDLSQLTKMLQSNYWRSLSWPEISDICKR